MTEEEKKSFYKSFGEVMKDTLAGKRQPRIPITHTCLECGEIKITHGLAPFEYLPYVRTHCWQCKTQTKHSQDY